MAKPIPTATLTTQLAGPVTALHLALRNPTTPASQIDKTVAEIQAKLKPLETRRRNARGVRRTQLDTAIAAAEQALQAAQKRPTRSLGTSPQLTPVTARSAERLPPNLPFQPGAPETAAEQPGERPSSPSPLPANTWPR